MRKLTFLIVVLGLTVLPAQAKEALLQTTANPSIKQGYVNTDEGQIHYWEAGNGPALLLIHQSSSSVEEYAGMVPYLSDNYQVVAFDWAGHGNSDDPAREFGVEDHSKSAIAVMDHLGIKDFHLLGNHGGALIAMNLAWRHPNRVNKLILSGTSGVKSAEEAKAFTESLNLQKRKHTERDGKSISQAWQRFTGYMPNSNAEEVVVAFINNLNSRVRPYDGHYGVLRWDRKPALESIKNREILLVQAENDEYVSHQETLLDILPNSQRMVVKDAGVFMFFEAPESSAKIISDFLQE